MGMVLVVKRGGRSLHGYRQHLPDVPIATLVKTHPPHVCLEVNPPVEGNPSECRLLQKATRKRFQNLQLRVVGVAEVDQRLRLFQQPCQHLQLWMYHRPQWW
eukprot:PhF_6_TR7938/c0_g1_i1/m.11938